MTNKEKIDKKANEAMHLLDTAMDDCISKDSQRVYALLEEIRDLAKEKPVCKCIVCDAPAEFQMFYGEEVAVCSDKCFNAFERCARFTVAFRLHEEIELECDCEPCKKRRCTLTPEQRTVIDCLHKYFIARGLTAMDSLISHVDLVAFVMTEMNEVKEDGN